MNELIKTLNYSLFKIYEGICQRAIKGRSHTVNQIGSRLADEIIVHASQMLTLVHMLYFPLIIDYYLRNYINCEGSTAATLKRRLVKHNTTTATTPGLFSAFSWHQIR